MSFFEPKKSAFICLIILSLPFLFFYWGIPFISHITIGGDYLAFPIKQQMELLFSIKTGSFPLYVPGFASGHSSAALTLGQIYHPLSHIASIMPGYWSGKAIEWNNFFKLLSLGIAQLALFGFLRKTGLSVFFSFLFSLITVYNLRVPDLYRYGAPLEAYTAFYVLCAAIGWYFTKPKGWIGPVCIIGVTYLLVCSGHPQRSYFGLIGAVLFTSAAPFFLSTMLPERPIEYKAVFRNWIVVCSCLCLGIILSSIYVLPFYFDFIRISTDRVGQDYAWAISNLDSFAGTLNNFFLPLHSDPYGAFGGSSLTLLAVVLPLLRLFKFKIPPAIWSIWGLLLFMFLFMQGDRTPVHRMVWEYMPFASSLRVPGRISLIMPFFIMLLLAWIVKTDMLSRNAGRTYYTLHPAAILTYISLALMTIYFLLYIAAYNTASFAEMQQYLKYPVGQLLNIPFFWVSSLLVILGISSLILFVIYTRQDHAQKAIGIILTAIMLGQLGIALKYRTAHWIETKHDSPSFEVMRKQKMTKLDYPYYAGGGLHSSVVIAQINESFMEPFLGKIFTYVNPVDTLAGTYNRMRRERFPHQVFIEGFDHEKAEAITAGAKNMKKGAVKLVYSSFNLIRFHVNSEAPAIFGLSYPYTGHWSAWVNGEEVNVYRANGAAHAVEIPEGESFIEFRYWSNASFWGIVISCITFAITGIVVFFHGLKGLPRVTGIFIALLISAGGFMLWYNSLYSGDNLETEYNWMYTPPQKTPNLAYGKKSWLSDLANPMPYAHTREEAMISKLVDGDRSPDSGFTTRLCDNPAWFLDLNNKENIQKVLLFESSRDTSVNTRPLTVAMSIDGSKWRTVASVVSPVSHDGLLSIVFDKPETARFIKIEASGESKLTFDEVEVYGQ